MTLPKLSKRLRTNERGSAGIWFALAMTMTVGMGAVAVDMSTLYATRGQLQNTADIAAAAAAQALPDPAAAASAAQIYAEKNMPSATYGTVAVAPDIVPGNWNSSTRTFTPNGAPVNAVQVVTRRAQANGNAAPTFFARALGIMSVDVAAAATATKSNRMGCIIALNTSAENAFYVKGNAAVRTFDCDIQVNSCHGTAALNAQGNVQIVDQPDPEGNTGETNVCGGLSTQGPAVLSPYPNADTGIQVADPFASVANPDAALYDNAADCDFTGFSASGDVDLHPGVYCGGISLTGNGTATFHATGGSLNDGLFILKDGPFSVAGNVEVTGNGVTFFLTGSDSVLDFGGTADIGLSAPTTGGRAGFVFFGDRDNPSSGPHRMRGTALGGYNGFIYLPGAKVEMTGTATGTTGSTDCTVLVADTFQFSGTVDAEAKGDCENFGGLPQGSVALVN